MHVQVQQEYSEGVVHLTSIFIIFQFWCAHKNAYFPSYSHTLFYTKYDSNYKFREVNHFILNMQF